MTLRDCLLKAKEEGATHCKARRSGELVYYRRPLPVSNPDFVFRFVYNGNYKRTLPCRIKTIPKDAIPIASHPALKGEE